MRTIKLTAEMLKADVPENHVYLLEDSWSYEGTGTTVEDHEDTTLTLARTGTGVYTLTFAAGSFPKEMLWGNAVCSTAATFSVCTYAAGVITVTIYLHDGNAQNTDEETVKFLGLFRG